MSQLPWGGHVPWIAVYDFLECDMKSSLRVSCLHLAKCFDVSMDSLALELHSVHVQRLGVQGIRVEAAGIEHADDFIRFLSPLLGACVSPHRIAGIRYKGKIYVDGEYPTCEHDGCGGYDSNVPLQLQAVNWQGNGSRSVYVLERAQEDCRYIPTFDEDDNLAHWAEKHYNCVLYFCSLVKRHGIANVTFVLPYNLRFINDLGLDLREKDCCESQSLDLGANFSLEEAICAVWYLQYQTFGSSYELFCGLEAAEIRGDMAIATMRMHHGG